MVSSSLVVFNGGFSAAATVVVRLLDLEAKGCRFTLLADDRFRVEPVDLLTSEDIEFLRARQSEARQVLLHQADDRHLFTDASMKRETAG